MPALQRSNLFHTPKDWEELMAWINNLSDVERIPALTAAMMAWNLASKLLEEAE